MKIFYKVFAIVITTLLFTACGHTNNLAKYDVSGSTIYFKENVRPEARIVKIEQKSLATKNSKKTEDVVLEIFSAVSSGLLEADKQKMLEETIDTKELLNAISDNLSEAIHTFLDVSTVESISDKPDYICTINLEQCKLLMDQNSVSVMVLSSASIVKRTTGEIVWENTETRTVPIEEHYKGTIENKAIENVFTALQLASLDPEQINQLVSSAADDVGTYMAETLREDVADAHEERNEKK